MKFVNYLLASLVSLAAVSCTKHFEDYKDAVVTETDEASGMFVFRTADGLYGAANADGEVVVEPEYQGIILKPPFIAAHLSDKEFEDECEKLAKKAGADKEPEDADEAREIMENLQNIKHDYIIPGYANSYYRVFNSKGKMLKDYALHAAVYHVPEMGDSAFYTINNYREKTTELLTADGESTTIEECFFTAKGIFGYRDAETLHMKMNGRWISLWGKPVGAHNGMLVLKGSNSDPDDATFEVVDANGELIYVGKYDIVSWIEDDSNGGIFIKVLEGQKMKGEKRSFTMRPMSIFFIDKDGKLNENLPDGYSTRKSGYDNNVYLINPQGREVYDYFWHN